MYLAGVWLSLYKICPGHFPRSNLLFKTSHIYIRNKNKLKLPVRILLSFLQNSFQQSVPLVAVFSLCSDLGGQLTLSNLFLPSENLRFVDLFFTLPINYWFLQKKAFVLLLFGSSPYFSSFLVYPLTLWGIVLLLLARIFVTQLLKSKRFRKKKDVLSANCWAWFDALSKFDCRLIDSLDCSFKFARESLVENRRITCLRSSELQWANHHSVNHNTKSFFSFLIYFDLYLFIYFHLSSCP